MMWGLKSSQEWLSREESYETWSCIVWYPCIVITLCSVTSQKSLISIYVLLQNSYWWTGCSMEILAQEAIHGRIPCLPWLLQCICSTCEPQCGHCCNDGHQEHNTEQWHHHCCEFAHSDPTQQWTVVPPLLWVGTFISNTTVNSSTTFIVSWHIHIQHNSEQWHRHYYELAHLYPTQQWTVAPPLLWVGTFISKTTVNSGTTITVSWHIHIQQSSQQWHHHYCELAHSYPTQQWTVAPPLLWVGPFISNTTVNSGTTITVSWHVHIQHNSEQLHHHYCELAHSYPTQQWTVPPPLLWVGTFRSNTTVKNDPPSKVGIKKTYFVDSLIPNILHDLPFSWN